MFAIPKTAFLAYFASKSVQRPWLYSASCKNPPHKKLTCFGAQSRMRGNETRGRIVTNFCTGVGVLCKRLWLSLTGFGHGGPRGVKFWVSPLTCVVVMRACDIFQRIRSNKRCILLVLMQTCQMFISYTCHRLFCLLPTFTFNTRQLYTPYILVHAVMHTLSITVSTFALRFEKANGWLYVSAKT